MYIYNDLKILNVNISKLSMKSYCTELYTVTKIITS